MIEQQIDIDVQGSTMSMFICHPERHGPYPVILFFVDAPGIRDELRDMARRFASVGYYVMLPNLYHRLGVFELGQFVGPEGMTNRERAEDGFAFPERPAYHKVSAERHWERVLALFGRAL